MRKHRRLCARRALTTGRQQPPDGGGERPRSSIIRLSTSPAQRSPPNPPRLPPQAAYGSGALPPFQMSMSRSPAGFIWKLSTWVSTKPALMVSL